MSTPTSFTAKLALDPIGGTQRYAKEREGGAKSSGRAVLTPEKHPTSPAERTANQSRARWHAHAGAGFPHNRADQNREHAMNLRQRASLVALAACLLVHAPIWAQGTQKVLRIAPHSNLTILDPIWTTAYITRNHGYMIYDTLFGMDAKGKIQPQMVDKWEIEQGQEDLDLHAARRTRVPRRQAGHRRGRHRVARALGQARQHGREVDVGSSESMEAVNAEDLPHQAEGAVRAGAGVAGQTQLERPLHHAQARGRHAGRQADRRLHRFGPVHLQERRVEAGREDRLPARTRSTSRAASRPAAPPAAKSPRWIASSG